MVAKKHINENYIRLKKIKKLGKYSDYPLAVKLLVNKVRGYSFLRAPDIKTLGKSPNTGLVSTESALVWIANILSVDENIHRVNHYIKLKLKYSNAVLSGDFKQAIEILDEVEAKIGWSIWYLEAMFYCLQQSEGLEANKTFLNNIYQVRYVEGKFDWIYYLSFLISERNENGVRVEYMHSKLSSTIDNIDNKELRMVVDSAVNYFILNQAPTSKEKFSRLLEFCQSLSIIDLYEVIIRFLSSDIIVCKFNKLTLRLLAGINDHRLDKLDENIAGFTGNTSDGLNTLLLPTSVTSINHPFLNYYQKIGLPLKTTNQFVQEYIDSTNIILGQGEDFNTAFRYFSRLSVNLAHTDDIYSILEIPAIFSDSDKRNEIRKLSNVYGFKQIKQLPKQFSIDLDLPAESIQSIKDYEQISLWELDKELQLNIYDSSEYCKSFSRVFTFKYLLKTEKFHTAFEMYATHCISNPNIKNIYSLTEAVSNRTWPFYKKLNLLLDSAIILDSYLSLYEDEKQLFNLKACFLSLLKQLDVLKPSELTLEHFDGDQARLCYFLRNICNPFVLEANVFAFKSTRDVTIERILICNTLIDDFELFDMNTEKEELERSLAVQDGLNEVDNLGLTVDQDRFRRTVSEKFEDTFNRYKTFLGIPEETLKTTEIKLTSSGSSIQKNVSESDSILVSLLDELKDIFLKNHEFGLDYYLSMRIRHGRFIGVCRGPFERRKLITKFSNQNNDYKDNKYWTDALANEADLSKLVSINNNLKSFSKDFDNELKRFVTEIIQIKSSEKQFAAFSIDVSLPVVNLMKENLTVDTSMDDFLTTVLEFFTISLELRSRDIKKSITIDLKERINTRLLKLQKEIESLHLRERTLKDEITAARTELSFTLEDVAKWFDISRENKLSIRTYTFSDIIDISIARTQRIYQNFIPNVKVSNSENDAEFHSNTLALMVDALTILLSNVKVHGRENHPEIVVSASEWEVKDSSVSFLLEVGNKVEEQFVDLPKLKKILGEISKGNIKSRHEGGSGFHKLAAMPLIKSYDDIFVNYDDGLFKVAIKFNLVRLQGN